MHLFSRLKIKRGYFNAGNNINAVTLAYNLASYGAGYAIVIRYGNCVYPAFLCYNDEIFNAHRAIAQLCVAMQISRHNITP